MAKISCTLRCRAYSIRGQRGREGEEGGGEREKERDGGGEEKREDMRMWVNPKPRKETKRE